MLKGKLRHVIRLVLALDNGERRLWKRRGRLDIGGKESPKAVILNGVLNRRLDIDPS